MSVRNKRSPRPAKGEPTSIPAVVHQSLILADLQEQMTHYANELQQLNRKSEEVRAKLTSLHADKRVAEVLLKQEADKNVLA